MSEPGSEHQDFLPRSWVSVDAEALEAETARLSLHDIIFTTPRALPQETELQKLTRNPNQISLLVELFKILGAINTDDNQKQEDWLFQVVAGYEETYRTDYYISDDTTRSTRDLDKLSELFDRTEEFDSIIPALVILEKMRQQEGNLVHIIGAGHILRIMIDENRVGASESGPDTDIISEAG